MEIREAIEGFKMDNELLGDNVPGVVERNNLAIAALEKQIDNGWILCSDRLPKVGKRYLVSVIWKDELYNYRKPAVYDAVYGADGLWHSYNYEPVSYEVIAWQPLPEPYQPVEM